MHISLARMSDIKRGLRGATTVKQRKERNGNMKREFLKGLELSDEVIDKIMSEHGKSVERYKSDNAALTAKDAEITGLKEQLEGANRQIGDFRAMDIDKIKQAAADWEEKAKKAAADAEAKIGKIQFDHALDAALSGAKAKNTKAVTALLDMDGIKLEDGKLTGLDKQLEKLRADNDYLFESETNEPRFLGSAGGGSGAGDDDAAIRAVMGLPPKTTD